MLTDTKLRTLKPKEKLYKVADRDGLYVAVLPSGKISFRFDYRINGRRETLTLGRYGEMTLSEARENLLGAKKHLASGVSPALEKKTEKAAKQGLNFGYWLERWFKDADYADSTHAIVSGIIKRDVAPEFGKKLMSEITPNLLRAHCDTIKDRGAPVSAVRTRDIVSMVFTYAKARGVKLENPADYVTGATIAKFSPRDRALSKREVGVFFNVLSESHASIQFKAALKLILLTLVRKGELIGAMWDEIDFDKGEWNIPAERMKSSRQGAGRPHVVYLSAQAIDLFMQLHLLSLGSDFVLPSYGQSQYKTVAKSSLNRIATNTIKSAQEKGLPLAHFTIHDLRRTASTHLHEAGYNSDWIEKALAHEQRGVRAVYNKAEYAEQRRGMLQDWANMVESWINQYRE